MSQKNPTSFTLYVPTKPYLKKYLQALYGETVVVSSGKVDTNKYFGAMLAVLVEKRVNLVRRSAEEIKSRFDKLTVHLEVQLPIWYLKEYKFGNGLSNESAITLTKLFEERFEEELFMFCQLFQMCGTEIKDSLEMFCNQYNIIIDEDISFDSLKKKEYRFRKNMLETEENFRRNCPPKKNTLLSPDNLAQLKESLTKLLQKSDASSLSFQKA